MVLLLGTVLDNKPVRAFVFSRPKAVLSFISRQDPTLSSDEARDIYLEWLAQVLSGASFECAGKVSVDAMRKCYQGHRDGSRWPRLGVTMTGLVDSFVEGAGDILSVAYSRAISASRALICDATVSSSNLSSLPCVNPSGDVPMRRCAIAVR